MTPAALTVTPKLHVYPDSDGKPMADNTRQLNWIVVLFGNLSALYRDAVDVFVAADLLWYPVEEHSEVRNAPDVFVVFGRPKGHRGSYQQWLEGDLPPTVVFEILSPGNTYSEMIDKLHFYEDHGVEEYYVYNPDTNRLEARVRRGEMLLEHRVRTEFVSPRLKIRFDVTGKELAVFYPDGRRFLSFEELEAARALEAQRADSEAQRADLAEQRAKRLVELARAVRLNQASPEQLAELEQLERDITS